MYIGMKQEISCLTGGPGFENVDANTFNFPILEGDHKQATSPTFKSKNP